MGICTEAKLCLHGAIFLVFLETQLQVVQVCEPKGVIQRGVTHIFMDWVPVSESLSISAHQGEAGQASLDTALIQLPYCLLPSCRILGLSWACHEGSHNGCCVDCWFTRKWTRLQLISQKSFHSRIQTATAKLRWIWGSNPFHNPISLSKYFQQYKWEAGEVTNFVGFLMNKFDLDNGSSK